MRSWRAEGDPTFPRFLILFRRSTEESQWDVQASPPEFRARAVALVLDSGRPPRRRGELLEEALEELVDGRARAWAALLAAWLSNRLRAASASRWAFGPALTISLR